MIDLNGDRPIYMQVVDLIENEILLKRLEVEDQAPSTNEFAKVYEINPATARKGLNILVDEGILYKKRGLGMFVTDNARKVILEKRQKEFFNEILPETIIEAKRLEIPYEEVLEYIKKWSEWGE